MNRFTVYERRIYGPIGFGDNADWILKLVPVGTVKADDPIEAVAKARAQGFFNPIIGGVQ